MAYLSGSNYEALATYITDQVTPRRRRHLWRLAQRDQPDLRVLQTEDGTLSLTADAGDTPLPDLADFADELATTLGAV